jgi:hypothetical protein
MEDLMNKKGFISTIVIYSFFVILLMLLLIILLRYNYTKELHIKETDNIKEEYLHTIKPTVLKNKILADNADVLEIDYKGDPNFTLVSGTNEGMYAKEDDYGISYYFRGAVDSNWVYFADKYWRIVRINGDGSIRIVYSGTMAPIASTSVVKKGMDTQLHEKKQFNMLNDRAEYVGYMYELDKLRGTSEDSVIKTTLDEWFSNNLMGYEEYLEDVVFCSDRTFQTGQVGNYSFSGKGVGTLATLFSGAKRIYKENEFKPGGSGPSLVCGHKEDAFTVEDIGRGNGQLTYPIGLLTSDEVVMGGLVGGLSSSSSTNATKNYLYTNEDYWLLTPGVYNSNLIGGFYVTNKGYLTFDKMNTLRGVRPVVNLSPDLFVIGSGTWNNPYVVSVEKIEFLPPVVNSLTFSNITVNSFTVSVNTRQGTNALDKYYFSIDGKSTIQESTTNSYTYNNLQAGGSYTVSVYVQDDKTNTSNTVEMLIPLDDYTAPVAKSLTASRGYYQITLTLEATPGSKSIAQYYFKLGTQEKTTTSQTHTFTGLRDGTTYAAQARAIDTIGGTSNTVTGSFATYVDTPYYPDPTPPPPSNPDPTPPSNPDPTPPSNPDPTPPSNPDPTPPSNPTPPPSNPPPPPAPSCTGWSRSNFACERPNGTTGIWKSRTCNGVVEWECMAR